jgi:hypothetical protein
VGARGGERLEPGGTPGVGGCGGIYSRIFADVRAHRLKTVVELDLLPHALIGKTLPVVTLYGFKERRDHRFAGALAGIRR